MVLTDSLTAIWFFSAIVLVIVSLGLLAYLVLTILKKKKEKKEKKKKRILQKPLLKKEEKKKTYLDELLFVLGLSGFVSGYLLRSWLLLITGTVIMFLSLYLLHHLLIHKEGEKKEKKKEEDEKEVIRQVVLSSKKEVKKQKAERTFETDLDTIYDLVMEKKAVKLNEVADKIKIPIIKAEEYAKILDEQDLINFFFPVFGVPILKKKGHKKVKVVKRKKNKKIKLILFTITLIGILVALYFILRKYGYIH